MSLYNKIIDLQKLSAAWQRVRRNKPAAGVDNITWQQFDENIREELKQLQIEMKEHRYTPLPVRNVTLYKGEKARVIALYSMRDKVVQQSLASELVKLFDGRLSSRSYAYRSEKSALQAIEDITASISTGQYDAVLKADITHFFDRIEWSILQSRLARVIKEDDVMELIRVNACTAMLDDASGELTEKTLGIHQGSAIAPVLSKDNKTVEIFPNKVRLKAGRFGQVLKLPYGIHMRTGKRSCFIDEDGDPVTDIDQFIDTIASYSLSTLRKVLSYSVPSNSISSATINVNRTGARGQGIQSVSKLVGSSSDRNGDDAAILEKEKASDVIQGQEVQRELLESFENINANIREILFHCPLMQYLCLKSKRTGYLTHFERQSVLYVFGHVGEEGKEFVHEVMRHTMNYQYNVTQRFIDRIPEKPISCVKLREQYRKVSAEVGCSCSFKRTKNCYPSPVLHALSLSGDVQDTITVPTSRTLSAEKEKKVIEELNVHKKAQELAVRILELRKQQRAIEKSVHKVERELDKVYDSAATDALEIEMGLLVRRKKADGYEWVIEI